MEPQDTSLGRKWTCSICIWRTSRKIYSTCPHHSTHRFRYGLPDLSIHSWCTKGRQHDFRPEPHVLDIRRSGRWNRRLRWLCRWWKRLGYSWFNPNFKCHCTKSSTNAWKDYLRIQQRPRVSRIISIWCWLCFLGTVSCCWSTTSCRNPSVAFHYAGPNRNGLPFTPLRHTRSCHTPVLIYRRNLSLCLTLYFFFTHILSP